MVKFHIPAVPPAPVDVPDAIFLSNAVAMAPVLPLEPIGKGKPNAQVNLRPNTGGHPGLQKLQRMYSKAPRPDTQHEKLFLAVKALSGKCGQPMLAVDEFNGIVPGCEVFKDTLRSEPFFDTYSSLRFRLPGSDIVGELEARVSTEDNSVKLLKLSLEDAVIAPEDLEKQFGKMPCRLPRNASSQEMVSYICRQPWGEMRFGYDREQPGLLANVIFDMMAK
jgi:hypothetical protein